MCQIIYAPNKKLLIMEDLEVSQDNNPDGFGIAFAQKGLLYYCKKMADYKVFLEALKRVPEDVPLVIHFRYTTHGETSKLNIHPFQVLSKSHGDPVDLCMAHNGSINSVHTHGEKKSDTYLYVEKILRPILKEAPGLIHNPGFQYLVQRDIGSGINKFIFFDGDGKVAWVNKSNGHVPKGCSELWYANEYSLKPKHRSTKNSSYASQEERWRAQYPHLWGAMGRNGVRPPGGQSALDGRGDGNGNDVRGVGVIRPQQQQRQGVLNIHDKRPEIGGHPNSPYFNFDEVEKDLPDEIKTYLKDGEQLLVNKYIDQVSLQGFGWVQYGYNSSRWERHLSPVHKRWKIATDANLRKELGIELPGDKVDVSGIRNVPETTIEAGLAAAEREHELQKEFERKYDEKNFRLLNPNETLEWVMTYPEEASVWAAKNGFFGSPKKIEEFINDTNNGADFVSEFIYRYTRKLPNVKTMDDFTEASKSKAG